MRELTTVSSREPPIKEILAVLSRAAWDDKEHFRFCFGFKQSVPGWQTARWVTAGSVLVRGKTTAGVKEVTLAQNPWYHIHSCLPHHNFINYRVLEMVANADPS